MKFYKFKPDKLKSKRIEMKFSMTALAAKADITPGTLSRLESGKQENIFADTLGKLAAALKVTPNYFMKRC